MSDTDSSEDYNNLSNISNADLDDEIEIRQFMLTGPSRNQSMRSMVENRLNLLLAERDARQRNQHLEQPSRSETTRSGTTRRQTTRRQTTRRQTTRRNTRRQQPQSRQIMRLQTDAIGNDCPICLNTFLASDIIVDAHNLTNGEPSCHYFHKNCLMQICNRTLNHLCPLCRMPINCNDINHGNRNLRQSSGGMRKKRKLFKQR